MALSFPPQFVTPFSSPALSTFVLLSDLVCQIVMAVCAEAERQKECVGDGDAVVREMVVVMVMGGGGVCRLETRCNDVTSAAGRQGSREKLPHCATRSKGGALWREKYICAEKNDLTL